MAAQEQPLATAGHAQDDVFAGWPELPVVVHHLDVPNSAHEREVRSRLVAALRSWVAGQLRQPQMTRVYVDLEVVINLAEPQADGWLLDRSAYAFFRIPSASLHRAQALLDTSPERAAQAALAGRRLTTSYDEVRGRELIDLT